MTARTLSVLVVVAALGSSCATAPVEPEAALPEAPETWTTPLAASTDPGPAWWLEFDSPGLVAAVTEALAGSPSLDVQQARLDAALAQARIAGADLKPGVVGNASGSRREQIFIGLPIPGAEGGVLSSTSTTLGLSLDVSWEIDLWGRIRAGSNAALAGADAAALELAATRLSVAGQTAKAWVALAEAGAQLDLARRTADNRRRVRERIERRFELGLAAPLDVRLARSRHQIAVANLEQANNRQDSARRQLEVLLRRYPSAEFAAGPLPVLPDFASAALPTTLVARRPDLQALEARLDQAGFSVLEARRALYPRLALSASVGRTADEVGDLLENDFSIWSVAGNLLQPLFQGGRLRAGVDLAEARLDELVALYVQALLDAYREVETLLAADQRLETMEAALSQAREESRAAEQLAIDEYQQGLGNYLTVLQAQSDHFDAASGQLTAAAQRVSNRIDLHLALGDGLRAIVNDDLTTAQVQEDGSQHTPPNQENQDV